MYRWYRILCSGRHRSFAANTVFQFFARAGSNTQFKRDLCIVCSICHFRCLLRIPVICKGMVRDTAYYKLRSERQKGPP